MSQQQPIDPRYAGRPPVRTKRRNWFGRLIGLIVLLFVLMLICVPLYAWSRIDKVDAFPAGKRPAETSGTTYLMVGSDSREGLSAAEKKKLGTGSAGGQRTDSIMLMHVPESGPTVLISVPRDSYLPIPGHGKEKINAAFSFSDGGPQAADPGTGELLRPADRPLRRGRFRRLRLDHRQRRRCADVLA